MVAKRFKAQDGNAIRSERPANEHDISLPSGNAAVVRARSRHGPGRPSVLRSHCRPDQQHRFPSPNGDSVSMRRWGCLGSDVRAAAVLIGSVFVLAACSQAIDYTYSRKNFSSSTFEADLSACKRQGPSISAFQTPPQEKRTQLDDAAVRDCMMAKGYKIGTEGQ